MSMPFLSADKAWVFRISHVDNLEWILRNGLCCRGSGKFDPNYRNIGNVELISKRASRDVPIPPGGTLDDYVPFYFTSRSPMLLNIKTGQRVKPVPMREIIILVASLHAIAKEGVRFVFTDRHAYLVNARYSSDLSELGTRIDWKILKNSDFRRDPNDLGKLERYQAEALIYKQLAFEHIAGVVAYDEAQRARIETLIRAAGYPNPVKLDGRLFF